MQYTPGGGSTGQTNTGQEACATGPVARARDYTGTRCSGLETVRYDAQGLHSQFGVRFRLLKSLRESHQTPWGAIQQFLYCYCKVE